MKKVCRLKDKFEIRINSAVCDLLDADSVSDVFVVEDYPKKGINFVDVSSVFLKPKDFKGQIEAMKRLIALKDLTTPPQGEEAFAGHPSTGGEFVAGHQLHRSVPTTPPQGEEEFVGHPSIGGEFEVAFMGHPSITPPLCGTFPREENRGEFEVAFVSCHPERSTKYVAEGSYSAVKECFGPDNEILRLRTSCFAQDDNTIATADYQPLAADYQPLAADYQPLAADYQPPAAIHQSLAANHQLPAANHQPPAANHHPSATNHKYDYILGIESRGFLYASVLSYELGIPLVLVRKKGKLPRNVFTVGYQKEYGTDFLEITTDDIAPNSSVLLVDDVLATGGTLEAIGRLLKTEFKAKSVRALVAYSLTNLVDKRLYEVVDETMALVELR